MSRTKPFIHLCVLMCAFFCASVVAQGTVEDRVLVSKILKKTKHNIDPNRKIKVYLPEGYATSNKSYPVIYYHHSAMWDNQRMFENGAVKSVLDRIIADGITDEFIFVAADYTNDFIGSFYQNNKTSGRWLDYTVKEVVPFIDREYRTIRHSDARAATGEYFGGYASIKLGMLYPEVFGVIYSLSPVSTGYGYIPSIQRPIWQTINNAKSYEDLEGDAFAQVFMAMSQSYLPNPKKPPFYADYAVDIVDGRPQMNAKNVEKIRSMFSLDHRLPANVENMKKLKALRIDWARYDPTQDHVLSNQAFVRLLDEYGIEHHAEEYRGNPFDSVWGPLGRMYTDGAPFFKRFLMFEEKSMASR